MSYGRIHPNQRNYCGNHDIQFSVHSHKSGLRCRLVLGPGAMQKINLAADDSVNVSVGYGGHTGWLQIERGLDWRVSSDKRKGYGIIHLPAEALGQPEKLKPTLVDYHTGGFNGKLFLEVHYDPTMEEVK